MSETLSSLDETTCSGFYVWRVRYDCRFESSSGMDRYHIDHKDQSGIIVTRTADLNEVCAEIEMAIGTQSYVTKLHEATYLGASINNPNADGDGRRDQSLNSPPTSSPFHPPTC